MEGWSVFWTALFLNWLFYRVILAMVTAKSVETFLLNSPDLTYFAIFDFLANFK